MRLSLIFVPAVHALSIQHRIFHPCGPSFEYAQRAELAFDTFEPTVYATSLDLSSHVQRLRDADLDLDKAYYQVALQRDGDVSPTEWDVSSVKLCHLYHATSDTITLYAKDGHVHALNYFVSPVPHNGACLERNNSKKRVEKDTNLQLEKLNTSITLQSYSTPPLPELRTPPALTTEGEPVKPIPEKSFIQKYWIYIVPMVIALLMSGGPEESQGRARS
ncbi:hypothetical protein M378DRAFT_929836 [Amanita muscaria Koide BX008]|uniref:ER membrane protein complex subunit 10 n=1 Tax=Amanita muscaria (strain Koide BX008) TaxID=946122 RepID=A0A0C2X1U2_AMAMK|nr:hypothetical protein M378DRAFT_929836 [Amanita muscaria Koide BX008]